MTSSAGDLLSRSALPLLDARALLAQRLRVSRECLVAHPETPVDPHDADAFFALVRRRASGEPLAYLLGEKEFYGRPFALSPDVLVPRPETELLVDLALERMRNVTRPRTLDLGTGSGCIAVSLALECAGALVTATDASAPALAVARRNAERLGAAVTFFEGNWYDALPTGTRFDLILSNPPYIAADDPHLDALQFEPRPALTDECDGLTCLQTIIEGARSHLVAGGWLMVEHGYDQAPAVQAMFARQGLSPQSHADGGSHLRVTVARC